MSKWLPLNSIEGSLDNFNIGDFVELDLGDTLIKGYYQGLIRHQPTLDGTPRGEPIGCSRWYMALTKGPKRRKSEIPELVSPGDYPSMLVRRSESCV